MSTLFIEDEESGEDIMLETEDFIQVIKELSKGHSFLYNQEDEEPMGVGDIVDETLQPVLRSVITNMKMIISHCDGYVDKEYISDLAGIVSVNPPSHEHDNEVVVLNYDEAVFVDKYRNEVLDWFAHMFGLVVMPYKKNMSELVPALNEY